MRNLLIQSSVKDYYNGYCLSFLAYYRVGNTCVKCPTVPWPVISFGGFVLLACIAIAVNGFTDSVCTKVSIKINTVVLVLSRRLWNNWNLLA